MVFVNNYTRHNLIGSPIGRVKDSSYGCEYGLETPYKFLRAKSAGYFLSRSVMVIW